MQIISFGESPNPAKRSEQPVLSLGAEAARLGLSVGRGVREPQCESVKRFSPVSQKERKSIQSSMSQTAMCNRKREVPQVPPGSIERGERAKVVSAYLGGLPNSGESR